MIDVGASSVLGCKGFLIEKDIINEIEVNEFITKVKNDITMPEEEIENFTPEEYWSITANLAKQNDKNIFETRLDKLRALEIEMNQKYGAETVSLTINHSYSNMIEVIDNHPYTVELAKQAIKNVGLEPLSRPVRGGTDGARLSFMGLPCPNLGTGGYGFHGPYEHVTVEGMNTAIEIIKELVKLTTKLK